MNGQELKQILTENHVNFSKLAEYLGITPQSLSARFLVKSVKHEFLQRINEYVGKDLFGIGHSMGVTQSDGIPIYDIRICAGNGVGMQDATESERISIPRLSSDCLGGYVYGDSMRGMFNSGDLLIMRPVQDTSLLNYGRPYVLDIKEVGAVVKLIYKSRQNNHVRLVSFNQDTFANGDRVYPDMEIHTNDILHWYRVVERHETIA